MTCIWHRIATAIACIIVATFIGVVACAGFIMLNTLWSRPVPAHEAPSGWFYDAACCSNRDCKPIPDSDVTEMGGGFFIVSRGEFIAFVDTRQGKDDQYHICVNEQTNARLCFYRKLQGS